MSLVIANFVLKFVTFRYCGNKRRSEEKIKVIVKLAESVNPGLVEASVT